MFAGLDGIYFTTPTPDWALKITTNRHSRPRLSRHADLLALLIDGAEIVFMDEAAMV